MAEPMRQFEQYTEAEAADRLAFADAALGAAGHEITDPYLNEIARQFTAGEISGDAARDLSRKHIVGR